MTNRLHMRFEQLERATTHLLQTVKALGDANTHLAPGAGQWSAAQVVQHLLVAEQGISQYLDKKVQQEEGHRKTGLGAWLRSRLLRVLLRVPFLKFKAPARVLSLMPTVVPSLPEMETEWAASRRKLERQLNEFPSSLLNKAVFRHPRTGMMTLQQTLEFMLDHVLHHQKQVERIARQLPAMALAKK